jgi:hypothetical protein
MYDPLKFEKTDHPDLVGGILWADNDDKTAGAASCLSAGLGAGG